jgi:hypothetical protein
MPEVAIPMLEVAIPNVVLLSVHDRLNVFGICLAFFRCNSPCIGIDVVEVHFESFFGRCLDCVGQICHYLNESIAHKSRVITVISSDLHIVQLEGEIKLQRQSFSFLHRIV